MTRGRHRIFRAAATAAALAMHCAALHAASNIVLDGSLGKGPAGPLTAAGTIAHWDTSYARISIPETYGLRSGTNLFHSFAAFSIGSGDAAVFSLGAPAANVVSRVTGGQASTINGLLKMDPGATGSAPNFFFINPAGIVFGAGAAVDVPAGLHFSTANYLKFPDGRFYADTAQASTFSAAPPEAFGFLGTTRAAVGIESGAYLSTESERLNVIAGDVTISSGAGLMSWGGDIRVAAIGLAAQEVPVAGPLPAAYGDLTLSDGGYISAWKFGAKNGGNIGVSAGRIGLSEKGASIDTLNVFGSGNAGDIALSATGTLTVTNEALIASKTYGAGSAGNIGISADSIVIDGKDSKTKPAGISSGNAAHCEQCGRPGDISVSATKNLVMRNNAVIWSENDSLSEAGSVTVNAASIIMEGLTSISADSSPFGTGGNAGKVTVTASGNITLSEHARIASDTATAGKAGATRVSAGGDITVEGSISSISYGAGPGGSVEVSTTGTLSIVNDGGILALAYGSGDAGSINVKAGQLAMAAGDGHLANINAMALKGPGNAGKVEVSVNGTLSMLGNAVISTSTATSGNAGVVSVSAGSAMLDRKGNDVAVAIESVASEESSGNAGSVSLQVAGNLTVLNGARVSSSTAGKGAAGSIAVGAANILVDGAYDAKPSSIKASATATSGGQTGNVSVNASGTITLANGGQLSLENGATAAAPGELVPTTLSVSAPSIVLKDAQITAASTGNVAAGNVKIRFTDKLALDPSSITTSANLGNGGSIDIAGSGLLLLDRSQITTSVSGSAGNGGDIGIRAKSLVMTTGFVQANTAAQGAKGGDVLIDVQTLVPSGNVLLRGGQLRHVFQPDVFGFNVIQAAAPTGLSGTIDISAPNLDISGTVAGLGARMLDAGGLGRSPCRIGGGSSLAQTGRGGFAPSARGLLGTSERAQAPAASGSAVSARLVPAPCRG